MHVQPRMIVSNFLTRGVWTLLGQVGDAFLNRCRSLAYILAVMGATIHLALRPRSWTYPVRVMFVRQVLFTAVDGIPASLRFAGTCGILIIAQLAVWMDMIGGSTESVAPFLWRLVVRELSPLLACLVVIGRSGIAIGTELAAMRVSGELEVLDSQGIDPMTYLVMPRIVSMVISIFCLAVMIGITIVVTGYVVAWAIGVLDLPWVDFIGQVSRNMNRDDAVFFASKTIIAGAFAGAICCVTGLNVRGAITDIAFVSSRVGIQALTSVFVISAILSVVFYGKLLIFRL